MLHFLSGQDVFVSLPTGAPVLFPPFTYGNGLTANVNTVTVVDSANIAMLYMYISLGYEASSCIRTEFCRAKYESRYV